MEVAEQRHKLITSTFQEILIPKFKDNLNEIVKAQESIISNLQGTLNLLFQNAVRQQEIGSAGIFFYLCILTLQSSLITGSYDVLLSLRGKALFLDRHPLSVDWNANCLYGYLEKDMKYVKEVARKKIVRLKDSEIADYRLEYAENYRALLHQLFLHNIDRICNNISFQKLKKGDTFQVLFGNHNTPLFKINCNQNGETQ